MNKSMISKESALPGRAEAMKVSGTHYVHKTPIVGPFPNHQQALVAMGCFWGAERLFWKLEGVHSTAVGYTAGFTKNPLYEEVCSGRTGHTEAVLVVFDAAKLSFESLLQTFWQGHNPTQGMRQGNDRGTQYRSGIYASDDTQLAAALASKERYQAALSAAGHNAISTEVLAASEFYYAEEYHQQYLAKNPSGYCGIGGTGVSCPV